ncbi:MAG: hypothetical protein DIU70_006435 [Bacillota bacterium]|nr:MAG: hypothetical protein DIU70_01530 [Bacillota bacterium]
MTPTQQAARLATLAATIRSLLRQMEELREYIVSIEADRLDGTGSQFTARVHYYGDPVALHEVVGGGPVKVISAGILDTPYLWEFDALGVRWFGYCGWRVAERLDRLNERTSAVGTAEAR